MCAEYSEEELGRRDAELAAGLGVTIGLIAIELVSPVLLTNRMHGLGVQIIREADMKMLM